MTSLREVSGLALGRMPTRASSGAVSSKMRPFDNAMLMLAMMRSRHKGRDSTPATEGLPDALDVRAKRRQLLLEALVAPVEVVDAVDHRVALRHQPGDDQAGRRAQVGGHHRGALQPLDAAHHGGVALD